MKKNIHQYIALFLGLLFILFAYFQLNDPDPYIWVSLYLLSTLLSFSFFLVKSGKFLFLIVSLGYFAGAVWLFPFGQYQGLGLENLAMKTQPVEFARESFGLGICGLVMMYYFLMTKK
jgi:hypothetical protein